MHPYRTSYKSLADYDLDRMLQQRRNLSKVQSMLSLYDKNNLNLVNHVNDLVRQNQLLRQKVQNSSPKIQSLTSSNLNLNLKKSLLHVNPYVEIDKSTIKNQNKSRVSNKFNHPRNVYLTPEQALILNKKMYKQAKTAHKQYDRSKEYEQFKEKLSEKKKQLRSSYRSKSNFQPSRLEMSRNVYLEQPQFTAQQRQPLNQLTRYNLNSSPQNKKKSKEKDNKKRQISPYQSFEKSIPYHSPEKYNFQIYQKRKDTQRSSSAIKIQGMHLENSIKIAEPRTKWGDLSSTYFEKSKWMKNDQNSNMDSSNNIIQKDEPMSKNEKSKKKKFLNVISLSTTEEKAKQQS